MPQPGTAATQAAMWLVTEQEHFSADPTSCFVEDLSFFNLYCNLEECSFRGLVQSTYLVPSAPPKDKPTA